MQKIGDYIHRSITNYRDYGLNHINESKSDIPYNFSNKRKDIINQIKMSSKHSEAQIDKYEKAINLIFSNDPAMENAEEKRVMNKQRKMIFDYTEKRLNKDFYDTVGQLNKSTLDVSNVTVAKTKKRVNNNLKRIKIDSKKEGVNRNSILKAIAALKCESKILTTENKVRGAELLAITKELDRELSKLETKLIKGHRIPTVIFNDDTDTFLRRLNTIITAYSNKVALNLQKGDYFEYLLSMVPALMQKEIEDGFEELILEPLSKGKVGNERSHVEIDIDKLFSNTIDFNQLAVKGYKIGDGKNKTLMSILPTQNKIDVKMAWGEKELLISAKNVNLKDRNNIKVVSGTSMLNAIQGKDTDFVNHYLNTTASHRGKKAGEGTVLNKNLVLAHNTMKAYIFYRSIVGGAYSSGLDKASLFAINDNIGGKIKIYDITKLATKALEVTGAGIRIDTTKGKLDDVHWDNRSAETASQRVTTLIKDVHQTKISASFNKKIIRGDFKN